MSLTPLGMRITAVNCFTAVGEVPSVHKQICFHRLRADLCQNLPSPVQTDPVIQRAYWYWLNKTELFWNFNFFKHIPYKPNRPLKL